MTMKRLATLIALSAASFRQKQRAETVAEEMGGVVESVANELVSREPS